MAKTKGFLVLNVENDQYFTVWEGYESNFARNFFLRTSYLNKYILYQDGRFMGLIDADQIYPFAIDPTKKEPLFGKRACGIAQVIGISTDFEHCLHWGMRNSAVMFDPETKQPFTVGMSGRIYFTIGETPDDILRFLRFKGFASDGDVKEKIRHIMQSAMQSLLSEFQYTLKQFQNILPNEILKLSEVCYRKVNDMFIPYGIQLQSMTKASLIEHVIANT